MAERLFFFTRPSRQIDTLMNVQPDAVIGKMRETHESMGVICPRVAPEINVGIWIKIY